MDGLISIEFLGYKKRSAVWFNSFNSLKTINAKVISFLDLYTKRNNQKALQFWRVVNSLKLWKTNGVFWYPNARTPKARGPGQLPGLPNALPGPAYVAWTSNTRAIPIEWSCWVTSLVWYRRVISIVASCHSAKLCAHAARACRSQHHHLSLGCSLPMWGALVSGIEIIFLIF